jgi:hypothetical protein
MLTTEEKWHLESLKKHPWFLILKRLEEEYIADFNREVMQSPEFDITSVETQKKVQEASMYIRARKWVFDLVNHNTLGVARPKV